MTASTPCRRCGAPTAAPSTTGCCPTCAALVRLMTRAGAEVLRALRPQPTTLPVPTSVRKEEAAA